MQLFHDRILILPDPVETKTKSGIYIPESAQETPSLGAVIACGPGRYAELTGNLIPVSVKPGDKVLYGKFAGQEIELNGAKYLIMRDNDLFLIP